MNFRRTHTTSCSRCVRLLPWKILIVLKTLLFHIEEGPMAYQTWQKRSIRCGISDVVYLEYPSGCYYTDIVFLSNRKSSIKRSSCSHHVQPDAWIFSFGISLTMEPSMKLRYLTIFTSWYRSLQVRCLKSIGNRWCHKTRQSGGRCDSRLQSLQGWREKVFTATGNDERWHTDYLLLVERVESRHCSVTLANEGVQSDNQISGFEYLETRWRIRTLAPVALAVLWMEGIYRCWPRLQGTRWI